ncbi:MAG: hypothetical protein QOF36_1617 [Microbacteriaceae bacterium]|nr:hypothetical protein [Microbacteriaceae bacterium]
MSTRTLELRTYHAAPGKLDELHARFRDHTIRIFGKHGIEVVGFFTPTDGEPAENTLVYLVAYETREAATAAWAAFQADPEWIEAKALSEANGPLVTGIESTYLAPTAYSPLT